MLDTPGDSGLKVPSANENEYCHFCFSSENLLLLFPFEQYIRPDMTSFIDTFIGVQLSSENDKNFTLCRNCIDAMEFCIAFRECCRKHHEAVRESRHFHRVMEHLHSFLQESVLEDVSTTNALETTTINHQAPSTTPEDATLEQCVPSTVTADEPSIPRAECPRQKRRQAEPSSIGSYVQQSKKIKHTEERLQGKGNHIRVLMRRSSVKSRPEINTETSSTACLDVANSAVNPTTEVNTETLPESCMEIANPTVNLIAELNDETSSDTSLQTATAAVNLSSEVNSDKTDEACLGTANPVLNSPTDTLQRVEPGEANSEFSNKPEVCKPCFVALKRLDISLLT